MIRIRHATANNLKDVNLDLPLNRLVVFVGMSGSGKSSLAFDVLFRASQGLKVDADVTGLPSRVLAIGQRVELPKDAVMSLGEYNRAKRTETLKQLRDGDLFIIDEPCAGLTTKETREVLMTLKRLTKRGISVIAVEHAKEFIAGADHVVEFGPKSGKDGGEVVFQGSIKDYQRAATITAKYVFSDAASNVCYLRKPNEKATGMKRNILTVKHISRHGLNDLTVRLPLASLVCLHGPSGSGKTTVLDTIYRTLYKGKGAWKIRLTGDDRIRLEGKQHVRRSYFVEQTPIGKQPTSSVASYLGLRPSDRKALMRFTVDEAADKAAYVPLIRRKLGFLQEVGLGYLSLNQPTGTLSGGEAQRMRLAKILSKKLGDRCVYLLDTPTRGLHLSDLPVLIAVFQKIIDKNNTIVVADNREEIIKNSDAEIALT